MPVVVYLDTRHISDIARDPTALDNRAVLRQIQMGVVEIGISLMHILELTAPTFRSYESARDFLRDVPLQMALERRQIIEDEVGYVCARLSGELRRPPRVFVKNLTDWGAKIPFPPGFGPADILDVVRQEQGDRDRLLQVAEDGAALSGLKEKAAVARDPNAIAALYVRDHLDKIRPSLPGYVGGDSAEEIIRRSGGLHVFPMLSVMLRIARQRLVHPGKKTKRNDIIDEYHVCYSPYAAVTTVDNSTFARCRDAKLIHISRITKDLREVPGLVERVTSGELAAEPSV